MSGDDGKGFPPFLGETLLANATVRLFGRLFTGLKIDATGIVPTSSSGSSRLPAPDNPLTAQLDPDRDPRLARIYGFSYQGNYFKMAAPAVFLVHGEGEPVPPTTNPVDLSLAGVEFKDETFADSVRMWGYQDIDFSIRIDISSGWLSDILLDAEMSDANNITGGVLADGSDGGSGLAGRSAVVGRSAIVGRSALVGRSAVAGRTPRS